MDGCPLCGHCQESVRMLTAADRCDRCQSQAWYKAEFEAGSLLFCRHCYNKHKEPIEIFASHITDETPRLYEALGLPVPSVV